MLLPGHLQQGGQGGLPTNATIMQPQAQPPVAQMGPPMPQQPAPQAVLSEAQNQMQAQHIQDFRQAQAQNMDYQAQHGRIIGAPQYPGMTVQPPTSGGMTHVPQGQPPMMPPQIQQPGMAPPIQAQQQAQVPQMPQQQQIPQQQQYQQQPMPQQQQQYQQQPMPQQQQQQPAGAVADQVFDHYAQQGVDGDLMDAVLAQAHAAGIQESELPSYIDSAFETGLENFGDAETYQDYMEKYGQLTAHLQDQYGDQADEVLSEMVENIRATGGDALVQKFCYDPDMLDPEIIMPYIEGGGAGSENPYSQYATPNNRGRAYGAGTAQVGVGQGSLNDPNSVEAELQSLTNPQTQEQMAFLNTPQGQQRKLELLISRNRMARQAA